ncbi:hypothetical protein B0H34DRAFT_799718 [Crassisporium funariophilum]|nr:hypothetical protein B0H34DRAFT_799718 [Crassisporium funariophilum]
MIFTRYALLSVFLGCLLVVKAQTTHIVQIGVEGSFFNPGTISAEVNDTITFVFAGDIHTVTQSSFATPCTPLPGGFSSGLAGRGTNGTAAAPTWDLHITNASGPIWFFCEATRPTSHCAAGMVGVINTPSIDMYNQFMAAAKLVTGTPAPTPAVVLTGIGAFATNSPAVPPGSISPTPTGSSTSANTGSITSATSAATSPAAAQGSSSSSHLGAIIGGAVGGVLGIIFILAGLFLLIHQRKQRQILIAPSTQDDPFLQYTPGPVPSRRPSETLMSAKQMDSTTITPFPSSPTTARARSTSPQPTFSPVRRPAPTPTTPAFSHMTQLSQQHHSMDRQASFASSDMRSTTDMSGNVNIHALANEVAAVLLRTPSMANLHASDSGSGGSREQRQPMMYVENRDERDADEMSSSPPPNYRTAMGPSPNDRGGVLSRTGK